MVALHYVILRHENIDAPHFDLMFETSPGSALATWRSDIWPIDRTIPLLRLGDHRRDYLTYEGPLTGNRGSVRRVESGSVSYRVRSDEKLVLELAAEGITRTLSIAIDSIRGEPRWTGNGLKSDTTDRQSRM